MTILTREQIDAAEWEIGRIRILRSDEKALFAAARYGLDLRDAVLTLCDAAESRSTEWWETFADRRIDPSVIREVVARVERGE